MKTKGSLILTEGRSGSNWLISLTNGTGQLGKGGEWLADWHLRSRGTTNLSGLIDDTLRTSSTDNGYFCIKIFPGHIHGIQRKFGVDIVKYLLENFDLNLVSLTRSDRMRQAISFARGVQTQKWTNNREAKRGEKYDFGMIARCYFFIDRSYQYWDSYVALHSLRPVKVVYEEMLPDPRPFVDNIASHCGTVIQELPASKHSIQRDSITEEWLSRFKGELESQSIVPYSTASRVPNCTLSNLRRLIQRQQLKPYPYNY